MPAYKEAFPIGSLVRIADMGQLEEFHRTWKHHHRLEPDQLGHAGQVAEVERIGFYHGGDVLYGLRGVPGTWHERCLGPVTERSQCPSPEVVSMVETPASEIFVSSVGREGNLGAFFEHDGSTGYFYLLDPKEKDGKRIRGAIQVCGESPNFSRSDLEIRWSHDGTSVGLLIRGQLWAAFVESGIASETHARVRGPEIADDIQRLFTP